MVLAEQLVILAPQLATHQHDLDQLKYKLQGDSHEFACHSPTHENYAACRRGLGA